MSAEDLIEKFTSRPRYNVSVRRGIRLILHWERAAVERETVARVAAEIGRHHDAMVGVHRHLVQRADELSQAATNAGARGRYDRALQHAAKSEGYAAASKALAQALSVSHATRG